MFFFHISQVKKDKVWKPAKGDRISFDLQQCDRGTRAVNIARV